MAGRPPKPHDDITWVKAPVARLRAPGMSAISDEEWNRVVPWLYTFGRCTAMDETSLKVYCANFGTFAEIIRDQLGDEREALSGPAPGGREVPHILLKPLLRAADNALDVAVRFGMTPRSRHGEGGHGNRKDWATKILEGNRRKVASGALHGGLTTLNPVSITARDLEPILTLNTRARQFYENSLKWLETSEATPLDVGPLTIVACFMDLLHRAEEQRGGLLEYSVYDPKTDEEIEVRHHPLLDVSDAVSKHMRKWFKEYGLSMLDRRVTQGEPPKEQSRPLVFEPQRKR